MKLNFWQWLGIVLVVVALLYIVKREMDGSPKPTTVPTTAAPM